MRSNRMWGLLLAVLAAGAIACAAPPVETDWQTDAVLEGEGPRPWTDLSAAPEPEFQFVFVSDRTGGHRPGVFEAALDKIDLLQPDFVMSVGDLIEGYTDDRATIEREWDEFEGFVARLEVPFFYVAGNHDFANETMSRAWRDRFGTSYYHFRHRDVLFLVLNSELFDSVYAPGAPVPGPDRQIDQLAYAERVLAEHADARFTFVVIHQPLWDATEIDPDWLQVESWLGDRRYAVVAGHHHRYTAIRRNDRRYFTLGSTGGVSRLRGIDHGEFDHVVWVTLTEDGPVYANLMLDGIHDADVRTRPTRGMVRDLREAILPEPFRVEASGFAAGEARFVLHNPLDVPLEVSAEVRASRDLVPGRTSARIELAPDAREMLVVPVRARETKAVGALAPAWIDWTLRAPKQDGTLLSIPVRSWIQPDREFECASAQSVVVDGDLDEWSMLPKEVAARPASVEGAPLATLRFEVACGDGGVFVAGQVADPTPFADERRIARRQDAVSLLLDARPRAERDRNEGFYAARSNGTLKQMLQTWIAPSETAADPIVGKYVAELPAAVQQASKRTESGYRFELFVPDAWLDERAGRRSDGFRLDVSVIDYALDGTLRAVREWRPNRMGMGDAQPIAGSGQFAR